MIIHMNIIVSGQLPRRTIPHRTGFGPEEWFYSVVVVLVGSWGNSPRDCGPGGQWLGFMFIWWGIVLMGSYPRTEYYRYKYIYYFKYVGR